MWRKKKKEKETIVLKRIRKESRKMTFESANYRHLCLWLVKSGTWIHFNKVVHLEISPEKLPKRRSHPGCPPKDRHTCRPRSGPSLNDLVWSHYERLGPVSTLQGGVTALPKVSQPLCSRELIPYVAAGQHTGSYRGQLWPSRPSRKDKEPARPGLIAILTLPPTRLCDPRKTSSESASFSINWEETPTPLGRL